MTGQTVINRALRNLGAKRAGRDPEAHETADAAEVLIALVNQMNAKRGCLFTVSRSTHTWTADQGSRTIGATGNLVATRPEWIEWWSVIPSGQTLELGRARPMSDTDYADITSKAQTSDYFHRLLYKPTVPNGTLIVWPVPTTAPTLVLYGPDALTNFDADALNTEYSAPPGYEDVFVYELAKRLSPEYGGRWTQELEDLRVDALATIQIANISIPQYGPTPAGFRSHRTGVSPSDFESGNF
jgi:hypothetical protein